MSVSCPSGLCSLTSLPQVTSQAWLESVVLEVLEPQPGVTAGFAGWSGQVSCGPF